MRIDGSAQHRSWISRSRGSRSGVAARLTRAALVSIGLALAGCASDGVDVSDAGACVAACEPCALSSCAGHCEAHAACIEAAADCDAVRACIMGPPP